MSKKVTTEDFVRRSISLHGDKYDYSVSCYRSCSDSVAISCRIHGVFYQRAGDHLHGCGCPRCGEKKLSLARKRPDFKYIEMFRDVHGDKYEYENNAYIKKSETISVSCPVHGVFLVGVIAHLRGSGCRDCNSNRNFWSHVDRTGDCWLWTGAKNSGGYGTTSVNGVQCIATRISYEKFSGKPVPKDLCVLHRCDNPTCVNPDHLFLGTHQENMSDKMSKGRHRAISGSIHYKSKLNEESVDEVRRCFSSGESASSLSARFLVGKATIRDAVNFVTWKPPHIERVLREHGRKPDNEPMTEIAPPS